MALVFIDTHDFIEQPEIIATFASHRAERHNVFGEAGASVADARIQETGTDAGICPDSVDDLIHIGANGFTHRCDGIDERNLHRKKSIGGVLDQFSALRAGDDDGRRGDGAVGSGNGIRPLVVAAVGERQVDFPQDFGGAFGVAPDDNAIGEEEVSNGGPFTKELRIRGNVEGFSFRPVAQDNFADPITGVNRDGTLFNDDLIVVDAAGDFPRNRLDVGEVGFAAFSRRSANRNEDSGA